MKLEIVYDPAQVLKQTGNKIVLNLYSAAGIPSPGVSLVITDDEGVPKKSKYIAIGTSGGFIIT